jgi:protein-tyrosine-phosphatase
LRAAELPPETPVLLPATHRVFFLCSGHYYRSRFAEQLFNWLAERAALPPEQSDAQAAA